MIILTIIVCYTIIGAIMGLNESETVEEVINEATEDLEDAPLWVEKLGTVLSVILIILAIPVVTTYYYITNILKR